MGFFIEFRSSTALVLITFIIFSNFVGTANSDHDGDPQFGYKDDQDVFAYLGETNEITSMRTPTTKFYETGNGKTTARIWGKPIHFENEQGDMVEFETDLIEIDDEFYDIGVKQNTLETNFKYDYNAGTHPPVKYRTRDGFSISWTPGSKDLIDMDNLKVVRNELLPSNPIESKIDRRSSPNMIEYIETYKGVTERYTMSTGKIKHDYILDNRDALSSVLAMPGSEDNYYLAFSGALEFSSGLEPYIDGQALMKSKEMYTTGSGIHFKTIGSGEVKHYLTPPYAYELENRMNSIQCLYMIDKLENNVFELSILTPVEWLLAEEREYPVAIDPSDDIQTIKPGPANGKDTFISDGSNENLNVGADSSVWLSLDSQIAYLRMRPIMYFDISSIPVGKEIIYANVFLYYYNDIIGNTGAMTVSVHRMTHSWTEGTGTTTGATNNGATWRNYDGSNSWNKVGGDYDKNSLVTTDISSYGWYSWNIIDAMEDWDSDPASNHGLMLIGTGGADSVRYLYTTDHSIADQRPYLEVEFYNSTPMPPGIKFGAPSVINLMEDAYSYYLDLHTIFIDMNHDDLNFSYWNGTGYSKVYHETDLLNMNITDEDQIRIKPMKDQNGIEVIKLRAHDNLYQVKYNLTVYVEPVNDAPVLKDPVYWHFGENVDWHPTEKNWFIGYESKSFWLQVFATDIETPESLSYALDSEYHEVPDHISISYMTGRIEFYPTQQDVLFGEYYLKVIVSDPDGRTGKKYFKITIKNTNDKPFFIDINIKNNTAPAIHHKAYLHDGINMGATEEEEFNFTIRAHDEDFSLTNSDEVLNLSIVSGPEDLQMERAGNSRTAWKLSFTPTNEDAVIGYVYINVSLNDSSGEDIDDWVLIYIGITNVNDPPVITKVNDKLGPFKYVIDMGEIVAWEKTIFTIKAEDIDDDRLSIRTDSGLAERSRNGTNRWDIQFTPGDEELGNFILKIQVLDDFYFDLIELKWNVVKERIVYKENEAPTIKLVTSWNKYNISDIVEIVGAWFDPDNGKEEMIIHVQMFNMNRDEYKIPVYTVEVYDDMFKYIFDSGKIENFTKGTYKLKFNFSDGTAFAIEDFYLFFKEAELDDEPGGDTDEKDSSGLQNLLDAFIILIINALLIIIIVRAFARKKAAEREKKKKDAKSKEKKIKKAKKIKVAISKKKISKLKKKKVVRTKKEKESGAAKIEDDELEE